jgi:hypothetical protein
MKNCPAPNSCHPALSQFKDSVLSLGKRDNYKAVNVMGQSKASISKFMTDEIDPTEYVRPNYLTFTFYRAFGPMPFIGDATVEYYEYTWWIAIDEYKRSIASDSAINWYPCPLHINRQQNDSGLI